MIKAFLYENLARKKQNKQKRIIIKTKEDSPLPLFASKDKNFPETNKKKQTKKKGKRKFFINYLKKNFTLPKATE